MKLVVPTDIARVKDPVERLFAFIHERWQVQQRRAAGKPRPWTKDPVLADYRFTCVYREDDAVTRWISNNWREPNSQDDDVWFAMCVARLLNLPESMEYLGYPVPFKPKRFLELGSSKYRGRTVFNAAYIINAGTANGRSKVQYLAEDVLQPLWDSRKRLQPQPNDTLNSYHVLLGQFQGFGSFMTAQVIADLKYVHPLDEATDWWTFAASGPGSRRGLNYVLRRPADNAWREDDWRMELGRLRAALLPMFKHARMPVPHAQDVQNCLCEYSKYVKAITTGQMPKRKFAAQEE